MRAAIRRYGTLASGARALRGHHGHRPLSIVLAALVALNMSQAVVVCVGADGHVALEAAGHDHCHHDAYAHDLPGPADHSHAGDQPCKPCTDIPVCAGAVQHAFKPSHVPALACAPVDWIAPSAFAAREAAQADLESLISAATFFLPLRTVVLQV